MELVRNKANLRQLVEDAKAPAIILAAHFLTGLGTAHLGKAMGGNATYIVPGLLPAANFASTITTRDIPNYLAYAAGVATAHLDSLGPQISNYFS